MPEHVHLLVLPSPGARISEILWRLKRPVTYQAVSYLSEHDTAFLRRHMTDRRPDGKSVRRFWQRGGGYDRNIWTAKELHEKIAYIHANPVRRGLVERPEDWPWSSWRAWMQGVDKPVRIDRDSLPVRMP